MRRTSIILVIVLTVTAALGRAADDATVTVVGCLNGINGSFQLVTRKGRTYILKGDHDTLFDYGGKLVQVTGRVDAGQKPPPPGAPATLRINKIKKLADSCE